MAIKIFTIHSFNFCTIGKRDFAESCFNPNNSTQKRGSFIEEQTHRLYSNDSRVPLLRHYLGFTVTPNNGCKCSGVFYRPSCVLASYITAATGHAVYYYTQTFYDDNSNDRKGGRHGPSISHSGPVKFYLKRKKTHVRFLGNSHWLLCYIYATAPKRKNTTERRSDGNGGGWRGWLGVGRWDGSPRKMANAFLKHGRRYTRFTFSERFVLKY